MSTTTTNGNLLDIVSEATQTSRSSYYSRGIVGRESSSYLSNLTPKSSPRMTIDNRSVEVLRRIIHITDHRRATMKRIYDRIDDTIGFGGKLTSFRTLLLDMGFRWKKTTDNRKI